MRFIKKYYKRIIAALMAELVDAHASGACWLSQWKFESSSGHHKKPPFMGGFLWCFRNRQLELPRGGSLTTSERCTGCTARLCQPRSATRAISESSLLHKAKLCFSVPALHPLWVVFYGALEIDSSNFHGARFITAVKSPCQTKTSILG